mgnify:CR=1 FL=1
MAKFDPKKADLNRDGKLSSYEKTVGEKRAAAMPMKHAMKMDHAMKMKDDYAMRNYKQGYSMQMGSKEIDSPSAFTMKHSMNMMKAPNMSASAATMKSFNSELQGVVLPGTDKSNENKISQSDFNRMQQEIKGNVDASRSTFDKQITSDSLTNILEKGYVPKLDQKRYDMARQKMDIIKGTSGDSKTSINRLTEHLKAYKGKEGVYADNYLKNRK